MAMLYCCSTVTVEQLCAEISSKDHIEVFTSLEPAGMWQVNDYIEADSNLTMFRPEAKSLDEIEIRTGFFNWVDYQVIAEPLMLWWRHAYYWVNTSPEKTTFNVLYFDPYGTLPSAGYPKAEYRIKGSGTFTPLVLSFNREADGGRLYAGEVTLSTGVYEYQYSVRNPDRAEEYRLSLSSFVVSRQPSQFENTGVADNQSVSSAKIVLSWGAMDPDLGGILRYKVYLGTNTASMSIIYDGYATSCSVESLDYGRDYVWQVEATNVYGVSSRSPVWRFKTIARMTKSFNYPNPFNPNTGSTKLVFDMAASGAAEVSVYTELGDLCWRKSFDGLLRGANEISYDGRDDAGRVLYSGPYVVVFKKTYSDGRQEQDRCRLLIIK
ncbi:MAG: hypothetical protein CVT48_01150 [Thermoplasmata archaeon HGW-Thermoplasmata-1]|nr:MAG: hypothetical protein CVT48_01150 [Thermoplasmata archaeon HGW-Thermoplasmata-1]